MAMTWNRKVFIRIIEVLLCIACVVALRVTDDESRRVFHYLRNRSREWSILNNVTWGTIGAALATATCGGYIIITTGLLIAAVTGELAGRLTELFLLGLGVILFGIVGSLSLASIESVPDDLIDNAAVLGGLCLLTCLAFIADLLMSTPMRQSKKNDVATSLVDREAAVKKMTDAMSLENETKTRVENEETEGTNEATRTSKTNGRINEIFDDSDEATKRIRQIEPENSRASNDDDENFAKIQRHSTRESRENQLRQNDQRQTREYVEENMENVRTLRDSRSYGINERETRDRERNSFARKNFYEKENDFIGRRNDEIETPLFPTSRDNRAEPMFAKIINPSVKIMRVERDPDDNYDTRNSDSSQYDNVPTRIFGNSNGNLKKLRDVSFNVPSLRTYVAQSDARNQDDIEMLEEWINVLKTTTGTQTGPSSPTDPGYVKHTANNWPRDFKSKTTGSSPQTRKE